MTDDLRSWYESASARRPKSYGEGTPSLGQERRLSIQMQLDEAEDPETASERGGVCTVVHRKGEPVFVPVTRTNRCARQGIMRELGRRNCDGGGLIQEVVGHTIAEPGMGEIGCAHNSIVRPGWVGTPGAIQLEKNRRKRERRARANR
jgi:hypothetical protein